MCDTPVSGRELEPCLRGGLEGSQSDVTVRIIGRVFSNLTQLLAAGLITSLRADCDSFSQRTTAERGGGIGSHQQT